MEVYSNKDNTVVKYLHEDGSETCIKIVPSCNFYLNELTGKIEENSSERNKYSVFVSFSVGCPVGCKMCYLSLKNYPYKNIKTDDLYENILEAVRQHTKDSPGSKQKYIKLCWMGMGDAFYNLKKVNEVTKRVINQVLDEKLAIGLDGVDIGTTLPKKLKEKDYNHIVDMNEYFEEYPLNDNGHKSIVRVFYSLHSMNNRPKLIPNAVDINTALVCLGALKGLGVDVIFHQFFIEKINDDNENVDMIIDFFKKTGCELRVLRYNECNNSPYYESPRFINIIHKLNTLNNIKYQVSPGSEIKAACGQFIMKQYGSVKDVN